MQTTNTAHDLLAAYSRHAGVPGLQFTQHGCARLLFEEAVAIDLEIDDAQDCIQLYSVLGPVPPGNCEALYRALLEGSLFGSQTGGATLSVDAVREEVLIWRRLELAVADVTQLARMLEELAACAQVWRQKLGSGELAASDSKDATPPSWQGAYLRG